MIKFAQHLQDKTLPEIRTSGPDVMISLISKKQQMTNANVEKRKRKKKHQKHKSYSKLAI